MFFPKLHHHYLQVGKDAMNGETELTEHRATSAPE